MAKNIGTLVNSAATYLERAKESRVIASWTEEAATQYQTVASRFLSEVTALAGRERTVNSNPNLSPTGKHGAVKEAVQAWFSGLTWIKNLVGSLETRLGGLYGPLFVLPKSDRSETTQAIRDWELREELRTLTHPERVKLYVQAAEANDIERLRAVQDVPGLVPLVPVEVRLRGDDVRASRIDPEKYRRFVETGELLNEVRTLAMDADNLAREFGLDTSSLALTVDELGPKVREAVNFAADHQYGARGKAGTKMEMVGA